jgi:hypothetical protein
MAERFTDEIGELVECIGFHPDDTEAYRKMLIARVRLSRLTYRLDVLFS